MMLWAWQMHLAWMQATMIANLPWSPPEYDHHSNVAWTLPDYEYEDEAEREDEPNMARKYEDEEQGDFREIDITGELSRASTEGLTLLEKWGQRFAPNWLRLQLVAFKHCLEDVQETTQVFQYSGGDHIEVRAARSLLMIDELLRKQAAQEIPPLPKADVDDLKLLQRRVQDVTILACSRLLNQMIMKSKGIPQELLRRLEAAFGKAVLQDDNLWLRF